MYVCKHLLVYVWLFLCRCVCMCVIVVCCALRIFVCMVVSIYVSPHRCLRKSIKQMLVLLLLGIQYCNSNFIQPLNKTFKST